MAMTANDVDTAEFMAESHHPSTVSRADAARQSIGIAPESEKKTAHLKETETQLSTNSYDEQLPYPDAPTEEEVATLRRVTGKIPWLAYTVAFVEFCERFSFYGTTIVFTNFVQQPRPPGSSTGAGNLANPPQDVSGALGMGQNASTGATTFNQFWSYVMPLLGGYIADAYLGRFATIQWSIAFALVGHVILVVSALPSVIAHPSSALGAFFVGLIIMGVGTGGFKSNIAPLIAEQIRDRNMKVKTLKTGERVIEDPVITISRVYLYFYVMINAGSLVGQIGMVYAELYVGFWLSFTLPTILFCLCPMVLFACKKRYYRQPPTGSVLAKAMKLWSLAIRRSWSPNPAQFARNVQSENFWLNVMPSRLEGSKPTWMTFDDEWVDQVRRGFAACKVFSWYPLYWLTYNQIINNLTSQAATMTLNGAPNDIITNIDPLALIIFIPIMDRFVYPAMRKAKINFTPLKRITAGFFVGSAAMISAAVIQYYIYKTGQCGTHMSTCEDANGSPIAAPINVWVQVVPNFLIAYSEIFASVTGLEYAFTKAPDNMRSLVQGVFLLQTAFASAINQALNPLAADPLLIWNYGVPAVLAFLGGIGFWWSFHKLDKEEDTLNHLKSSKFLGRRGTITEDTEGSPRSSSGAGEKI